MYLEQKQLADQFGGNGIAVRLVPDHGFPVDQHGNFPAGIEGQSRAILKEGALPREPLGPALAEAGEPLGVHHDEPFLGPVVEDTEAQRLPLHAGPEVVVEVADRPLDLALRLGAPDAAPLRGKAIVDRKGTEALRRFPIAFIIRLERRPHVVVQHFVRHAPEVLEGERMARQERRRVHAGREQDECLP